MLDLAKIEAGRVQLESADFHLGAVFDNVLTIIVEPARLKGLAVTVDITGVPRWLHDDCRALQLQVSVEGTGVGVGIAPESRERLFQDFEQADASTTRHCGGTGPGPAITRRLAQLMDGEGGAHSTPGAGSRFCFTARLRPGQGLAAGADSDDLPTATARVAKVFDAQALLRLPSPLSFR